MEIQRTILLVSFRMDLIPSEKLELTCRRICSIINCKYISSYVEEKIQETKTKSIFGNDKINKKILYTYYFDVLCNEYEEAILKQLCDAYRIGFKR